MSLQLVRKKEYFFTSNVRGTSTRVLPRATLEALDLRLRGGDPESKSDVSDVGTFRVVVCWLRCVSRSFQINMADTEDWITSDTEQSRIE